MTTERSAASADSARPLGSSFRDPSGFVYTDNGIVFRQVNEVYKPHYDRLMSSGLYAELTDRSWLVPHEEVEPAPGAYRTLRPQGIPFISYPYEWCFSQLKDAALLTLDIQLASLSFDLSLKDASAFNVQFVGARPVFIDTLSFETYRDGKPWVAYRQFCEHFLAPLALMSQVDPRTRRLVAGFIDGIPLDLASRMLPRRTWLKPGLLTHVHMHARSQVRHRGDGGGDRPVRIPTLSKTLLTGLLNGLRQAVLACAPPRTPTEWGDYYEATNYSPEAMAAKERLVAGFVDTFSESGRIIHDLGANTGRFSRLLARSDRYVVAHDIDELAVERHYLHNRAGKVQGVLPLLLDLASPSPGLGWLLEERSSTIDRIAGGTVVALALIHHLAISGNVPLARIASFFGRIARTLVIEFVPKDDSQVRRLLATREDIFPGYTREGFERVFSEIFDIVRCEDVPESARTLYAMRRR